MKDLQPLETASAISVAEVPVTSIHSSVSPQLEHLPPTRDVPASYAVAAPLVPWQPPEIPTVPFTYKRQPSYADILSQNIPTKESPPPITSPISLHQKKQATSEQQETQATSEQQEPRAHLPPMQTFPLQHSPLQPRETLPVMLPYETVPKPTTPQRITIKSSKSSLFEEPLEVGNYHLKFRELLKSEEIAHSKLLDERSVFVYLCLCGVDTAVIDKVT